MNILPCPFCGSAAELKHITIYCSPAVIIKCRKCGVGTRPAPAEGFSLNPSNGAFDKPINPEDAEAEAVRLWNTREGAA